MVSPLARARLPDFCVDLAQPTSEPVGDANRSSFDQICLVEFGQQDPSIIACFTQISRFFEAIASLLF